MALNGRLGNWVTRLMFHRPTSAHNTNLPAACCCCRCQVLGEDLKLVLGQQDRMQRGGDTWANPVSYDKLAVRYRWGAPP
jgi:hypothetical protein